MVSRRQIPGREDKKPSSGFHPERGKRRFTTPPSGSAFGDGAPAFSPDGRTLAFYRAQTTPGGDIFLAPASDGLQIRQLTHDHRQINGLAWTPDGKDIVFSSARGGDSALWRIPALGERRSGCLPSADAFGPAPAPRPSRSLRGATRNGGIWRLDLGLPGALLLRPA